MPVTTCIFDAYGTLFDVTAAARAASTEPGGGALATGWQKLADDWRRKQLEYTWLRAIMGQHADFAQVTADGLDWALDAAGLADPALRARLLALYEVLPAYPEVPSVLAALKTAGVPRAILSNGTPAMLSAAARSAGIADLLDDCLSVEAVCVFKPDARVYALVTVRFACLPADVLFISSNGWDVAGAAGFGFRTVWVNRSCLPVDRLPGRPDHILNDLAPVPGIALT